MTKHKIMSTDLATAFSLTALILSLVFTPLAANSSFENTAVSLIMEADDDDYYAYEGERNILNGNVKVMRGWYNSTTYSFDNTIEESDYLYNSFVRNLEYSFNTIRKNSPPANQLINELLQSKQRNLDGHLFNIYGVTDTHEYSGMVRVEDSSLPRTIRMYLPRNNFQNIIDNKHDELSNHLITSTLPEELVHVYRLRNQYDVYSQGVTCSYHRLNFKNKDFTACRMLEELQTNGIMASNSPYTANQIRLSLNHSATTDYMGVDEITLKQVWQAQDWINYNENMHFATDLGLSAAYLQFGITLSLALVVGRPLGKIISGCLGRCLSLK